MKVFLTVGTHVKPFNRVLAGVDSLVGEEKIRGKVFAQGSMMQRAIAWSDRFFTVMLVAIVALLLINIVVKIKIQHAAPVLNATLLIIVVSLALYLNAHRVEAIGEKILVLGQFF